MPQSAVGGHGAACTFPLSEKNFNFEFLSLFTRSRTSFSSTDFTLAPLRFASSIKGPMKHPVVCVKWVHCGGGTWWRICEAS